jgi:hypothetical protein
MYGQAIALSLQDSAEASLCSNKNVGTSTRLRKMKTFTFKKIREERRTKNRFVFSLLFTK